MIIKVCGMREPENIRAVSELGVDMIGFVFYRNSPRYVSSVSSHVGLLPDYASISETESAARHNPLKVGVFVSEMPQNIITMAYNYKLDYVQLHGMNDDVMIDNLRRTLDVDIRPGIKFIKAIGISDIFDIEMWRKYKGVADLLLFHAKGSTCDDDATKFDWSLLDSYDGDIPFIIGGGIGPEDAEALLSLNHPMLAGVDINSRFESSPAVKDISLLEPFVSKIRNK